VKRFASTMLSIGLALTLFASAQTAPQPAEPGVAPQPGVNQAMVRVIHASPNAEIERVGLTDTAAATAFHEFTDLEYLEVTDYVPVFAGSYDVVVELAQVDDVHAAHIVETQTLGTVTGSYYTIVLMGLVLPREAVGTDDGFIAWLEGLFTAERQDLTLFPMVLDDLTHIALAPTEAEIRLVHAAPGTDTVDLVQVRAGEVDVLHTEAYGNASGHTNIFPAEGDFQIRIAGSDAVAVDLAELDVSPGMIHTVILTGTPIEDVPLQAILVSNPWVDPIARPPGAVAPVPGALPAAEAAWIRDRLFQIQAWLETAEARLAEITGVADAEAQATAALDEVAAARAALEQVRLQLETFGAPAAPGMRPGVPVQPTDPAAVPAAPAEAPEPDEDEDEEPAEPAD
jgi:hypothetical protein